LHIPTSDQLRAELTPPPATPHQPTIPQPQKPAAAPLERQIDPLEAALRNLTIKHRFPQNEEQFKALLNDVRHAVSAIVSEENLVVEEPTRDALLSELDKFLLAAKDIITTAPRKMDLWEASDWFVAHYLHAEAVRLQEHDNLAAKRLSIIQANDFEAARIKSKRFELAEFIAAAILTLMAFLFLPLLLRIERNTRTLATHAQQVMPTSVREPQGPLPDSQKPQ
jgi:hypothetical protein